MHFFVNMVNIQKIRFAIRSISGFSGSGDSDTRRSGTSDTAFDQGIKAQFATLGYATYGTKPQPGRSSESDQGNQIVSFSLEVSAFGMIF